MKNKNEIISLIKDHPPITMKETPLSAAVLVLMMQDENDNLFLIVTKRSETLAMYAGDYCFPGGMREDSDKDFIITALREVEEELGIPPQLYQIIGQLDDFNDRYGNVVRPFVALINQLDFEKSYHSDDEIETIYYFPLIELLEIKPDANLEIITRRHPSYCYVKNDVVIWGLTAAIMVLLSNIIFNLDKSLGKKIH